MQLRRGNWIFQPGWASTLAVLLLLPGLVSLGLWQLDRAHQKAELQAVFSARAQQPALPLGDIEPADPDNRYRRVLVEGRYDTRHQLLLDNQIETGQPGYHVLTPLQIRQGLAILINRGWLPAGAARQQVPDVAVTAERVTITGWLSQPAMPGLRLGDATGTDLKWPRIVPFVDYERLAALLGYPLQSAIILLEPDAAAGYRRDWQPRFGGFGPERHQGYAVQWFALAAALVVLYVAANTRRLSQSGVV